MEASQWGLKNHECRQLLERLQEQGLRSLKGFEMLRGGLSSYIIDSNTVSRFWPWPNLSKPFKTFQIKRSARLLEAKPADRQSVMMAGSANE
jgi:hypothetical protein